MGWKSVLSASFVFVVLALLIFYWFVPTGSVEYMLGSSNTNFSLSDQKIEMQFYPNMRFVNSNLSYKIDDCPLQRQNDMEYAFEILENKTILTFYSVENEEDIFITCNDSAEIKDGLFVAGEGGPTNITTSGNFNVILSGRILLFKDSKCENPNVAIHELLHVLGFDHSENSNNIMYPVVKCRQTIGQDTIDLINEIYSYKTLPDLYFEDASASMEGKYLDIEISVRNGGLSYSENSVINVFADDELIKEIDLDKLKMGEGRWIGLENVWVPQISVEKVIFEIASGSPELDDKNNKIELKIKS